MADFEVVGMSASDAAAWRAAIGGSEEITSGASPLVCGNVALTLVTSGATHGVEIIELDDLPFTLDDFSRPENYGFRHVIALKVQTENDDVIHIRLNNGSTILAKDRAGNTIAEVSGDIIVLDYVGATAVFEWGGEQWYLNQEDNNNSTTLVKVPILPSLSPPVAKDRVLIAFNSGSGWSAAPVPGSLSTESTAASPTTIIHDQYCTALRSSGSAGVETVVVADSSTRYIGTRHFFEADEFANIADSFTFDVSNIKALDGSSLTSITMDTVGQYLLLELWAPSEWRVLRGTAVVSLV